MAYVKDFGKGAKTRCAIEAGYSVRSAASQACVLLKRANILKRLEELRDELAVMARITAGRILEQYERFAWADPAGMYDAKGNLLPIDAMQPEIRQLIQSFELEERVDMSSGEPEVYSVRKIKMVGKREALDQLARWRDIFPARKTSLAVNQPGRRPDGTPGSFNVDPRVKPIINLTVLPPNFQYPKVDTET